MLPTLPASWHKLLKEEVKKPYFLALEKFVEAEQEAHDIYPPAEEISAALKLTPYEKVSVLLLGQDPYPGKGQAHGLSFSVRPGVKIPGSLANIYK